MTYTPVLIWKHENRQNDLLRNSNIMVLGGSNDGIIGSWFNDRQDRWCGYWGWESVFNKIMVNDGTDGTGLWFYDDDMKHSSSFNTVLENSTYAEE